VTIASRGAAGGLMACACIVATANAPPASEPQHAGKLRVVVTNVRAATGKVHVDICREREFLKDCALSAEVPAIVGTTVVTVPALPPGRYAVQATYDQNGNGKVDRALFGIPKEGVGFSRDARISFGPPKWQDAAFDHDGNDQAITLRLRYFLGGNAPGQ